MVDNVMGANVTNKISPTHLITYPWPQSKHSNHKLVIFQIISCMDI